MRQKIASVLVSFWKQNSILHKLFLPLAWIFQFLTLIRKKFYYLKGQAKFSIPIIIVGNISLGGTGKTPLVGWLANELVKYGFQPGIVTHGYGSKLGKNNVVLVTPNSQASAIGDEALVLARMYQGPIVVGRKRTEAIRLLQETYPNVDIVICDDGLQHYQLERDIEIAVVDGNSRFGNGFCLPVGPLRESVKRLKEVDFIVVNGQAMIDEWPMTSTLVKQVNPVSTLKPSCILDDFIGKTVHAVAGIGNPARFFQMLQEQGIHIIEHAFSDHYQFKQSDLQFKDTLPILMTEKDAVKCRQFELENAWAVLLDLSLPTEFMEKLLRRIQSGQKVIRHLSLPHLQATSHL
jgi:tetraacyldisaccharide 4'-kinase